MAHRFLLLVELLLLVFLIVLSSKHSPCQARRIIGRYSQLTPQESRCDFSQGNWIYDNTSEPLYNAPFNCPFIGQGFDCLRNGRPDQDYLKYRWQPSACDLPRFNGLDFLERYRGKKIMFVGDSLSNNMWQSLTCMLHTAVPTSNYTLSQTKSLSNFSFPEYGVSVMFLKNGFLVDFVHEKVGRVLKLDSISWGEAWKGMDVLIFNSFHWWMHTGSHQTSYKKDMPVLVFGVNMWDYYQISDQLIKDLDHLEAYKLALTTWGRWIETNLDFSKTEVFYQGVAAVHLRRRGETKPVEGSTYPEPNPGEGVVKSVLSNVTQPVYLLDITLLTQLRKDGHPSLYTGGVSHSVDCSHWCLAGVPDAWNEILYAALLGK